MKRVPLIVGNWKMHMTLSEARGLVLGIHHTLRFPGEVDVVVAPPFTALPHVSDLLKDSYLDIAAQNLHHEDAGAFTGEVAGPFIRELGAHYVIIGHSERRQLFGETDGLIAQKVKAALRNDLIPILCVGESLEEREAGRHFETIGNQLTQVLQPFQAAELKSLVVAYEPVWAIGTGKTAERDQIEEMHVFIREGLVGLMGPQASHDVRILYGGSVHAANSREILSIPAVNGALVGGASLKVPGFVEIVRAATPSINTHPGS